MTYLICGRFSRFKTLEYGPVFRKQSCITKVVDFYKNYSFNATVVVEEKRACIIDVHGTINDIKMLATDYKFQVEVLGSKS